MAVERRRVCLDFSDIRDSTIPNKIPPLCWITYESGVVNYICDFKSLIDCRFKLGKTQPAYNLYLSNALLPDSEHIDVLRDGDIVKVVPQSLAFSADFSTERSHVEEHCTSTSEAKSSQLKRKKKRSIRENFRNQDIICIEPVPCIDLEQNEGETVKKKKRKQKSEGTEAKSIIPPTEECNLNQESKEGAVPDITSPQKHSKNEPDLEIPKDAVLEEEPASLYDQMDITETSQDCSNISKPSPDVSLVKKKRVRRNRKRKNTPGNPISFPNSEPLVSVISVPESLNLSNSSIHDSQSSSLGKHIRFDTTTEDPVSTVHESKNKTEATNSSQPPKSKKDSKDTNKSVFILDKEKDVNGSSTSGKPLVLKQEPFDLFSIVIENSQVLYGPPRVGDIIAYRVLELSENYCPEVSNYKVAKVKLHNPKDDVFEMEIISEEKRYGGIRKFDLLYEDEEGVERVEAEPDIEVKIKWPDIIEPRLLNEKWIAMYYDVK